MSYFCHCFGFCLVLEMIGIFLIVSLGALYFGWFELKYLNNLQHIEFAASWWSVELAANYTRCKIVTDCGDQLCHLLQVFWRSATSVSVQQVN